jgi:hypothetical protein
LLPDLLAPLKTEVSDKVFEFLTGGRMKNMGATLTGMQTAAKGMAGPLGRMFRIDDMGSLGRYARDSMEHAQSLGMSSVGNNESFNRKSLDDAPGSANMYSKLLPNKFANLALGQFNFQVDESGKAIVTDDYDASTLTAQQYHQKARKELVNVGKVLQGSGDPDKDPFSQIVGGLMEAYKMHGSAQLATKQNEGQSNLRPLGLDIAMGSGYKQTDEKGNVLTPEQISAQQKPKAALPPPPSSPSIFGPESNSGDYGGTWTEATAGPVSPYTQTSMVWPPPIPLPSIDITKMSILGFGG